MFDKLKSALGSLTKIATHTTLSSEDIDSFLWDFEVALIESDVASEAIESLTSNLRKKLAGMKIPRSEDREKFVLNELKFAIRETFSKTRNIDVIQLAKSKAAQNKKDHSGPSSFSFWELTESARPPPLRNLRVCWRKTNLQPSWPPRTHTELVR